MKKNKINWKIRNWDDLETTADYYIYIYRTVGHPYTHTPFGEDNYSKLVH